MRVFTCVLVLCGVFSSHAASVGFSEPSPCTNQDDGTLLPVVGECSEFYMCLKGQVLKSSCGSTLHFDPVSKTCIEMSRSLCVPNKNHAEAKPPQVLVKVEAKPQPEDVKSEIKPKPEESKPKQIQSELKPEEPKPQQIELVLKPEIKPKPEEAKPQKTQTVLKPETKPKAEEPKPQEVQTVLKPEEVKLHQTQTELKPETKPKPEEPKPQKIELIVKPEIKPKPEEAETQVTQSELKPEPEVSKPQQTQSELMPKQEQPKPQPEQQTAQENVTPSDFCLGKAIGSFVPSKLSCNQYYICLGNRNALKSCPADLHFNVELGSCSSPEMANCLIQSESVVSVQVEDNSLIEEKVQEQIQPEETKTAPETVVVSPKETSVVSPKEICSDQANGAMIPIAGSCSDFLVCLGNEVFELSCGTQHFDPVYRACISSANSGCVEGKVAVLKAEQTLDGFVGDTYMGTGNDGVAVGNANVEITNTGSVSNFNLVSSSSSVAVGNTNLGTSNSYQVSGISAPTQNSLETPTGFAEIQLASSFVGDVDMGMNNSGITVGNANVSINNTGVVSNANIVVASQNVEIGNTDLGSYNSYVVNGSSVVINNKTIPLKQTGLPVNKKQVSHIEQVDLDISSSGLLLNAQGVTEGVDIGNTNLGQGNSGIAIGNANIKINNSGTVKDVNVVSGVQNSVVGNTDLGSLNSVDVDGVAIPNAVLKENKEVVVAVIDEENAPICVGVPSGTLFPKAGNCQNFLTCEEGVAYVATCPNGLHFNAESNVCDWPEQAGCA